MMSEPEPKVLSVAAKTGSEHSPQMRTAPKQYEINFFTVVSSRSERRLAIEPVTHVVAGVLVDTRALGAVAFLRAVLARRLIEKFRLVPVLHFPKGVGRGHYVCPIIGDF